MNAPEKYPHDQEQRNKRENKPTQYLTRAICLRPRGKGERDFIDSTINYKRILEGYMMGYYS